MTNIGLTVDERGRQGRAEGAGEEDSKKSSADQFPWLESMEFLPSHELARFGS